MTEPETSTAAQPTREELLRQWLEIMRPDPSYYTLLGVPELEPDAEAIHSAARQVKRKLRAYQIGTYRKQALDLLTEVGQAVAVLTNEEKKAAYDRELLARWKASLADLYRLYCEGTPRDPPVLEAWLGACAARGIPVTRLIGPMLRRLGAGLAQWPPHGAHSVSLPVNVWLYRDVVILGQCAATGPLADRVEAVKKIQKQLAVSEGLARLVAEEVIAGQHLFARQRLVTLAKRDPAVLLVRLGRRVRRYGGHIGRQAKIIMSVAALLGVKRVAVTTALEQLAGEHGKAAERQTATPRSALQAVPTGRYSLADLLADRPLGLTVALAALVGLGVLVVVFLVASGLSSSSGPAPGGDWRVPAKTLPDGATQPSGAGPDLSELEMLKSFTKKYPVSEPKPKEPPAVEPEPERVDETEGVKPATKFFNVPATAAPKKRN
jgi:hypothetical protein